MVFAAVSAGCAAVTSRRTAPDHIYWPSATSPVCPSQDIPSRWVLPLPASGGNAVRNVILANGRPIATPRNCFVRLRNRRS